MWIGQTNFYENCNDAFSSRRGKNGETALTIAALQVNESCLETGGATKTDEFSEKFQREGGFIFNPKISLQILASFGRFPKKSCNIIFGK